MPPFFNTKITAIYFRQGNKYIFFFLLKMNIVSHTTYLDFHMTLIVLDVDFHEQFKELIQFSKETAPLPCLYRRTCLSNIHLHYTCTCTIHMDKNKLVHFNQLLL